MYATRANPARARKEEFFAPEKVEKHGYIPLKRRVEDMMAAGQRLLDYRAGLYDQSEKEAYEKPEFFPDVTREPGFDFADAAMLRNEVENRLRQQADEINAQKGVKINGERSEESPDTSGKEGGTS